MVSPDSYIDYGFYYMISAALQRRVWLGPPQVPVFPNQYVVLVGKPGLGKSLVISAVIQMLKTFPLKEPEGGSAVKSMSPEEHQALLMSYGITKPPTKMEDDLLIPIAPDNFSGFEALVASHSKCTRMIKAQHPVFSPGGIYLHKSLAFGLEELSSLLHKNCEDVVRYLLRAFDCSDYKRETKHQGIDIVTRPCLNLLAGTTPDFMQEVLEDRIMSEGLSARIIFVYEWSNRFHRFSLPQFTTEQLMCRDLLLTHIKKLTGLFGQCELEPDAQELFRRYYEEDMHDGMRGNKDMKLDGYYQRKNIHLQKLAMAMHFAEDCSGNMKISLATAQKVLEFLDIIEHKMHYALQFKAKSPMGDATRRVKKIIRASGEAGINLMDIWIALEGDLMKEELDKVIEFLKTSQQITSDGKDDSGKILYKTRLKE